jgi:hypothetical protein
MNLLRVGTKPGRPPRSPPATVRRRLDPWKLVWGQPYIDSATLATLIEQELERSLAPDFRTRLLIRDASRAIRSFWGARKFDRWLTGSSAGARVRAILDEDLGRPGFRYIRRRLVTSVNLTMLKQVLELLGHQVHGRVEMTIAGSIPSLVGGLTARPTDDIDIVDEVPAEIRGQRAILQKIKKDYGLAVGHVQSHYLPAGWQRRRKSLGNFGGLRVYLVDEYDVFVSKLSSKREKHKQDLRVMSAKLKKGVARRRLLAEGRAFLDDPKLRPQIEENWRFIYQEPLESGSQEKMVRRGKPSAKRRQANGNEGESGRKLS